MANTAIVGILKALLVGDAAEFTKAMSQSSADAQKLGNALAKDLEPRQRAVNAAVRDFLGGTEIRRAEEYAQAVQQIGGADRLVEADQLRVNKAVSEALQHFRALGQEAPAHLVQLQEATRGTTEKLTGLQTVQQHINTETANLGVSVKNLALGYLTGQAALDAFQMAGREVIQFFKDSIREATEADKIQRQLTAALEAQGTAFPQVIEGMDALAKKYQRTTIYSDDLIKSQEALLIQVGGVMPAEMDKALAAVTNLASGLGRDLPSATMMVAKSFEDNFGALKKAGVDIDEARARVEGMDYVLGQIQKRFNGQAQAEVQSYAGQIAQLSNEWKDFQESVGNELISSGLLTAALASAKALVFQLTQQFREASALLEALGTLDPLHPFESSQAALKILNDELHRTEDAGPAAAEGLKAFGAGMNWVTEAIKQYEKWLKAKAGRETEAEKAARAHAEAIKSQFDEIVGKHLADKVRDLSEVYGQLTMAQKADATVMARVTEEVMRLAKAGAQLPPVLERIRFEEQARLDLNAKITTSGRDILNGFENQKNAVLAWGDAYQKAFKDADKSVTDFLGSINSKTPTEFLKIFGLPNTVTLSAPPADPWKEFDTVLAHSAGLFRDLAQTADGAMASIAREIGIMLQSMQLADQGGKQMLSGWKQLHGQSKNVAAGMANIAAGALEAWSAIDQATQSLNPKKNAAMGALAGAKAGAAFGPWGIAIGAGVGAIVGALRDGHEKTRKEILKWADDLFGGINNLHGLLTTLNRDDLFGKLTQGNAQQNLAAQQEIQNLLDLMQKYGLTVEDLVPSNEQFKNSIQKITDEYLTLKRSGFGDDKLSKSMASGLNDAIRAALELNQKLPPALENAFLALAKGGGIADDVARKLLGIPEQVKVPWQDLQQDAQDLGIDLAALGPAFQNAKLFDTADALGKKFNDLLPFIGDMGLALDGVGDKALDMFHQFEKAGIEVPASLKGILQALADQGRLTDAAGNKLDDLSTIKFAKDPVQEIDLLVQAIQKLIDKLDSGLGGAFDDMAERARLAVDRIKYEFQQIPTGFDVGDQPNFPDAEAGAVAHASAVMARVAASGSAPSTVTGVVNLDGRQVGTFMWPHVVNEARRLQLAR